MTDAQGERGAAAGTHYPKISPTGVRLSGES